MSDTFFFLRGVIGHLSRLVITKITQSLTATEVKHLLNYSLSASGFFNVAAAADLMPLSLFGGMLLTIKIATQCLISSC